MRQRCFILLAGAALLAFGCTSSEVNPFLTLSDVFLGGTTGSGGDSGGGGDGGASDTFRRSMTIRFANFHPDADVESSMIAWINVGSIRSADQQDTLLRNGYVQLTRETKIGSALTLPVGTFVFNGPGLAGATPIRLGPAAATMDDLTPSTTELALITPDGILIFSQPPVSCDSAAFIYRKNGVVLPGASVAQGGTKTLSQVNVYQCSPLKPGLFFKPSGGSRQPNEYLEGENIEFHFSPQPDDLGNFGFAVIGG